ncbi:MAG: hypothetical protein ACK4PI_07070 [Tepidisphaerales bacterium]
MLDAISIAAAGMQTASLRLTRAADDLSRAMSAEPGPGGSSFEVAAPATQSTADPVPRLAVELTRVRMLYGANAKVLTVAADLSGTLLDVLSRDGR